MKKKTHSIVALFMALCLCVSGYLFPLPTLQASAAGSPTTFGLVELGIKAFNENWVYSYGGASNGATDCSGLIAVYYYNMGLSCPHGATSQGTSSSVFHGDIAAEGMPRIHGLLLTQPDLYDWQSGEYGHIGIYTGNGYVVENTTYGSDMHWKPVSAKPQWNAWHVFDNGTQYPSNGWYAMNGAMYHYTNYQYDINTTVDGYEIGQDGIAKQNGSPIPVDSGLTNSGYVSASTVGSYLASLGIYDGKDNSTWEIIGGGDPGNGGETDDPSYNGKITGSGVNLRSQATTSSSVVDTLTQGTMVQVLEETSGQTINGSSTWYKIQTKTGKQGYVFGQYLQYTGTPAMAAPTLSYNNGYVSISGEAGADFYFTTDGSDPTVDSNLLYVSEIYHDSAATYKAIASKDGKTSKVTTLTVLSNGDVFTDISSKDWFFDAMDHAVSQGIFSGNGDGTLSPKANITRGQFVRALANLDGVDLSNYGDSDFTDVPSGKYYSAAITWAVENGYVGGMTPTTFAPNANITREQMCLIIARYKDYVNYGDSLEFADHNSISNWAKDAVYACKDAGVINGKDNNKFDPRGNTMRAEAAAVLVRVSM